MMKAGAGKYCNKELTDEQPKEVAFDTECRNTEENKCDADKKAANTSKESNVGTSKTIQCTA